MDENNIPESLNFSASDTEEKANEAKAILMSIWDPKKKETLRIDLWTKEMTVDEMKHFFHQTLVSMSDTLERATNEDKMAGDMRDFLPAFCRKLLQS